MLAALSGASSSSSRCLETGLPRTAAAPRRIRKILLKIIGIYNCEIEGDESVVKNAEFLWFWSVLVSLSVCV